MRNRRIDCVIMPDFAGCLQMAIYGGGQCVDYRGEMQP